MRQTTGGLSVLGALAAIVLVLFLGLALLYAYRSQSPAMQMIPVTALVTQVQQGRVRSVVIEDGRATATLVDATQQQAQVAANGEPLVDAIDAYNRTGPAHPVDVRFQNGLPAVAPLIVSIFLSLLPVLVIAALILLAASAYTRAQAPRRYEALSRLADLRDRGVLTEEEFQREKRQIFK